MKVNTITNHHEVSFCNRHDVSCLPFLLFTLTSLTMISGLVLASSIVSADDNSTVDQINITVPMSCTMSGTGQDSHNANINNGTYTANIGTTTMHVFCNDNAGFAIYAAGYTGDEIGGTNSNKLVGTSASGNAAIESGLATSAGNPDVSNWAMKLAITQDSGDTTGTNAFTIDSAPNVALPSEAESGATAASFSEYHVVPNEYVKVAHKVTSTDMTANTGGVILTTTYAAYISKTQPADTYSGQVIYTLVHPSSEPAPIVCNPSGTTIGTNTNTDIKCMKDISSTNKSTVLSSMTTGTQYTLTDKRDKKTYTVSKLADGKVWMTQNLDLDLDAGTTYTNLDTDLGWNTQTNSYQTASWTPSRSTYATATNNIHEWCQGGTWNTQYGYCELNNTPESYDPGDLYWNTEISDWSDWGAYYNSCDYSTTTPSCDESLNPLSTYTSSTGTEQYHLGNYYNWPAAIASNDASIYGAYNETTGEYENLETHQSICPAGWTLPYVNYNNNTNQPEGDFVDLWTEYGWDSNNYSFTDGISTVWSAPLYFAPAGAFIGRFGNVGYDGLFRSSVADGDDDARYAYLTVDGNAYPADVDYRSNGYSVRCLLR